MTDSRLALIRFVTSRQADLQGLRNVAFAVTVLATMGVVLWIRPAPPVIGTLVVLVVNVVLSEGSTCLLNWWYGSRYGRVSAAAGARGATAQMLMGLGAMLDLTPLFPLAGCSGFVFVVFVAGARIAYRDFPWRGYYLALVALPVIAPAVEPGAAVLGYFPAYAASLAALAVMGVVDHRLLRSSLRRLRQQAGASA